MSGAIPLLPRMFIWRAQGRLLPFMFYTYMYICVCVCVYKNLRILYYIILYYIILYYIILYYIILHYIIYTRVKCVSN